MVTATVTVDISSTNVDDLDHSDRKALQYIPQVPDGARLIVVVGARELLMHSAVTWLHQSATRLQIEVSAKTPSAARRWYDAIRTGDMS